MNRVSEDRAAKRNCPEYYNVQKQDYEKRPDADSAG
jgi:hypothetical protein